MDIDGYRFEYVCAIEPHQGDDGIVVGYMPQHRYFRSSEIPLNAYGNGPFCRFKIPNRLSKSGVYALFVDHECRYIGECSNLSKRFNMGYGNISPRNCFKGGQETNCRINNLVYQAALKEEAVSLWFFPTADYKMMESALRMARKFAWNRI